MDFTTFANTLRPAIGAEENTSDFTKTLFEAILPKDQHHTLKQISTETYKSYFNGHTGISRLARSILPFIEKDEFVEYLKGFPDSATQKICDAFADELPGIGQFDAGERLAELFEQIITDAAKGKKKRASEDVGKTQRELEKRLVESGRVLADGFGSAIEHLLDRPSSSPSDEGKTSIDKSASTDGKGLSSADKTRLERFRSDSKAIMRYVIDHDPAAEATDITLVDQINDLNHTWQYELREIENADFRKLVIQILKTLVEYTYYLSDEFLRFIPERGVLWFRNESWEEGQRLRNVLQPESFRIRKAVVELYKRLYPIPEEDEESADAFESEVVDDSEPSDSCDETGARVQIINNPTIVNQHGEKNIHIDHVDTVNL